MKPYRAFLAGVTNLQKVAQNVLVLYILLLVIAIALGSVVAGDIQHSLGHGQAASRMLEGFDAMWYRSFSRHAQGLSQTFHPAIVGIGAVFENLNDFLEGHLFHTLPIFFWLGLVYLLLWTFASAGFIARFVKKQEEPFLSVASRFFPRFVILAIMAGILYYLIFHLIMGGISRWIEVSTRDTTDARLVFFYGLLKYLVVWFLVFLVNMIFDYSKIYTVAQDVKLVVLAPVRALAFVIRHPLKTFGLYYLVGLTGVLVMLFYWLIAPGAGQKSMLAIWGAFILGQLYVLFRMFLRTLFYSSQSELYLALQTPSAPEGQSS